MPEEERPHLDTTPRISPQEVMEGGLYPYNDWKGGWLNNMLNPIRRVIAPINPFASQQVPSRDSVGLGDRWGNGFWVPFHYLSNNVYTHMFPNHYDALNDASPMSKRSDRIWGPEAGPGVTGDIQTFKEDYPRACNRSMDAYKRCKMVNGMEKCEKEMNNTVEICPTWAIEEMADEKRFEKKVLMIQREEYHRGMTVSSYNEGRTIADISNKTHVHGTRKYLRPDTMWADERYQHVTPEESKAAKERHEAYLKSEGRLDTPLKPIHGHSNTGVELKHEQPLY